jgi:hypothetical protein
MYTSIFAVKSTGNDETSTPQSYGTSRVRVGMGTTIAIHAEARTEHDASSDVCSAAKPTEHRGYHHGADRREIRSGSISAANAVVADALAKCLVCDHGDTRAVLLEPFDARVVAWDFSP